VKHRTGDTGVTVWCGNYQFGGDDFFLRRAATVGRKYVDKRPEERPPEARFREELEGLRRIAPAEGLGLIDQLAHRWTHPDCPPCLYVLTCTLRAPDRGTLLDDAARPVQELVCTKVGQARHTLAARLPRYKTDVLGGVSVVDGSPTLHVLVYGNGPVMLLEREIQQVARSHGSRAQVVDETGVRRRVGSETYVGVDMIDALCTFARERQST
jgi:hypothetical protein